MIEEAAGRPDYDVRRWGQRRDLRPLGHAPVKREHPQIRHETSELTNLRADLLGQLSGGADDEPLHLLHADVEAGEQARRKGQRLAAAGGTQCEHVPPREDRRQAALLNGRERLKSKHLDGSAEGRREAGGGERVERHG